jgi:hypothetical protein
MRRDFSRTNCNYAITSTLDEAFGMLLAPSVALINESRPRVDSEQKGENKIVTIKKRTQTTAICRSNPVLNMSQMTSLSGRA